MVMVRNDDLCMHALSRLAAAHTRYSTTTDSAGLHRGGRRARPAKATPRRALFPLMRARNNFAHERRKCSARRRVHKFADGGERELPVRYGEAARERDATRRCNGCDSAVDVPGARKLALHERPHLRGKAVRRIEHRRSGETL